MGDAIGCIPLEPYLMKSNTSTARRQHPWLRTLVLACVTFAAMGGSAARATDYIIELVLFEHRVDDDGSAGSLWFPKVGPSLRLGSEKAEAAGFTNVDTDLTLTANAQSMANSGRYRVLRHLAWQQEGLAEADAVAIRVNLGSAFDIYLPDDLSPYEQFIPASGEPRPERQREARTTTVNGTIKVRLGRFLHLEALLVHTDTESGKSYRLSESRKMRSRELHYIDNPRFGLLTRIVPVEETDS